MMQIVIHQGEEVQAVLEPYFLYGNVGAHQFQLIVQLHQGLVIAECGAEQCPQRFRHHGYFRIFGRLCPPVNGFQRVIEEMRVDLGLQRLDLGLLAQQFIFVIGVHQSSYPGCHPVKTLMETSDLIIAGTVIVGGLLQREFILTEDVHLDDQSVEMAQDRVNQPLGQNECSQNAEYHDAENDLRRTSDGVDDGVKRNQADIAPVVIRNLTADCEIGVIVRLQRLVGIILQQERPVYQVFGEPGGGVDGIRAVCQDVVSGIEGLKRTVDGVNQSVGIHIDQEPSDGRKIEAFDFPDISPQKKAGSAAASCGPADRTVSQLRVLQGMIDKFPVSLFVGGPVGCVGKVVVKQDDIGDSVLTEGLIIG